MSEITTVVFDIGNVLAAFQWRKVLQDCGFPEAAEKKLEQELFLHPRWNELDRGREPVEKLLKDMRQACSPYEKEFDRLFLQFPELVCEFPYSASLLRGLRSQGLQVLLLSNYSAVLFPYAKARFSFLKEVDGGVISYQEKLIKPEPEIYQLLLKRYQCSPEKVLFFDDRLENVEAAQNQGMHAWQVQEGEDILLGLREYGIFLPETFLR